MKNEVWEVVSQAMPRLALRRDVPYREVSSFGVGANIAVLAEPEDDIELSRLLKLCSKNNISVFILGGGSNIAGADGDTGALTVRLCRGRFSQISVGRTSHVTAGGAVRLSELARAAAQSGLGGLAPLAGIPGTLGGALRMNAGANGKNIGDMVVQICGCTMQGSIWTAEKTDIVWGYRHSSIPADVVITSAILQLEKTDGEREATEISREIAARRAKEPQGRTAGCIFRNPGLKESAGQLIDSCNFKGCAAGDIEVSEKHANYLVNRKSGTESELLELMIRIRRGVAEKYGIYLLPEVAFANPQALPRLLSAVPAPRVAVIMGGNSSEREVSLRSGAAVGEALRNAGLNVSLIDVKECKLTPEILAADVVYSLLHGGFGENGDFHALLERAGKPFVGSGSAACRLVMDKIATKKLLDAIGLPTAKWATVTPDNCEFPAGLQFPVVLKAPNEGSTVGIAKVARLADWPQACRDIFQYDSTLLVEEFIEGVEITVPIIGDRVFPAIEICSPHGFYDYDAKYVYKCGKTQYFCPVRSIDAEMEKKAGEIALKFFHAANCRDLLRVDFIVGRDNVPYVLEGNSIPGCTATSLVPKSAGSAGVSFERMTASLVKTALERADHV